MHRPSHHFAAALLCVCFAGSAHAVACTKTSYDDVKDWGLDQIEKDYCSAKKAIEGDPQAPGGAVAPRAADPTCTDQMATDMKVLTEVYKRHAPSCAPKQPT